MNKADPMVALYGTILCEDDGYQAWKDDFFIDAQLDFASRVPFSSRKAGPEGLHQNTNAFTQSPDTLNDMNGFYAFDFGDLHVLYLNTSFPFGKGSPQYLFAEKDLAATQQPWKIVVADKPAYSRGGQSENKDLIEMTRAIFEAQKVDLVLSVNGIHHLVAGTAQEPLQNQVGEPYTLFQSNQDHFAVLDIAKSKIKIFIYNENNEIIENFEITK